MGVIWIWLVLALVHYRLARNDLGMILNRFWLLGRCASAAMLGTKTNDQVRQNEGTKLLRHL